MKRKIIIRFALLVFVTTMFYGCYDNLLDQKPISTVTSQLFWSNYKDADAAVNGMYSLLRKSLEGMSRSDVSTATRGSAWGDYVVYGDLRSGDWITPNEDNDWKNLMQNNLRSFPALRDLQNWRFFYRVIEQCNQIITYVPTISSNRISQEQINQAVAQATAVRAFIYLYITRIWGDVPLNTTVENVTPLPRTSKEKIWEFAVSDLIKAIPDLPVEYTTNGLKDRVKTRTRFTKGAAYATLAHLYMWMKEYQKAFDAVTEIQNLGIYRILDASQYRTIFDKGQSDEGILEMYYNIAQGESVGYYGMAQTWFFIRPFTPRVQISISMAKAKIAQLYDPNDKRLKEFFMGIDLTNPDNPVIAENPLSLDDGKIIIAKYRKEPNLEYKFDNNVIIFRYAELLLLKAEAAANLNKAPEAIQLLNIIRNRAGLEDFKGSLEQQQLIDEILQERRRELVAEFQRFYDLMRNGKLHEFTPFISAADEANGAAYWPVNDEAFRNNPNMEQNKFWK